jgi:outer membrane lipoprotein carrier protein
MCVIIGYYTKGLIMKVLTLTLLTICHLFAQIETYQADFVQVVTSPSNKIIKYNGMIYIKQPNKMLWNYTTPILKYVYMNNLNIIIDEPELEQAIYTKLTNEINLLDFLNNPDLVDDKYTLKFQDNKLISISYNDELENNINISFKNIRVNTNISDQLFQFIAPLDYDIIKK